MVESSPKYYFVLFFTEYNFNSKGKIAKLMFSVGEAMHIYLAKAEDVAQCHLPVPGRMFGTKFLSFKKP